MNLIKFRIASGSFKGKENRTPEQEELIRLKKGGNKPCLIRLIMEGK